ncbi:MAG: MFS transporter [Cyanobacteria bacterium SZAS TMP-1]|nr:MFS transporter [Cyanobacteria bacterium SZAS TMP-1]
MQANTLPPSGQTTASRLMWFFAFVYVAEGLAQVSGILRQPLNNFLLNGLHWDTASVTSYMLILGLPWMVKPLYGLVSDCVPLFGYRRKSYLFLFNLAATAALLTMTRLSDPAYIRIALFVDVTAMAASSALCGALLVEHGKNSGLAGKFCSQQTLWVNIANIVAAFSGGWLCSSFAPSGALHWAATVAMFGPLLVVASTYHLIVEEKTRADFAQLKLGLVSILTTLKAPSTWGIAGFLMLWAFNPGFGAPLYSHMQGTLHYSQSFIGDLNVIYAAGAALGGLLYMKWLSPRYSIKTLAAALIICGAGVQAMFVFMGSEESAMALNFIEGLATSMALLNAHVIATNRCPDHAEGFMYGILLSAANVSFSASQAVGGYLYDRVFHTHIEPLILLSAALTFSCLILLPFFNFDRKDLTAPDKNAGAAPGNDSTSKRS